MKREYLTREEFLKKFDEALELFKKSCEKVKERDYESFKKICKKLEEYDYEFEEEFGIDHNLDADIKEIRLGNAVTNRYGKIIGTDYNIRMLKAKLWVECELNWTDENQTLYMDYYIKYEKGL